MMISALPYLQALITEGRLAAFALQKGSMMKKRNRDAQVFTAVGDWDL